MATEPMDFAAHREDAEALERVLSDLEDRSRAFGAAITGALASATRGGEGLETVLKSIALRMSDVALSAGLKPLESALGTAISGLAGTLAGGAKSGAGLATVTPFAEGGVVAAPAYFPMGGGMGLMGEAGAEAILPLKRGSDGALGVATDGGGQPVQVVFNVTAQDAASFRKSEGQIAAMLARTVARGRRGL
ncbi:phage tail tape measure protein [Rhizobium sp. SG2393]|uniref:phage tail tape measure protein n=1 Tax=Rhizobium sp. SG2393 TaxID=3276279 RepID=UPI00366CD211